MEPHEHRRFMILGSARTGSNLLLSLLSAHPSIKTYGELYNLDRLQRRDLLDALDDPVAYLRARVYKEHRPDIVAVGFKMFYDHLTDDYFQKLVDPTEAADRLQDRFARLSAFMETHCERSTLLQRFRDAWEFLTADRRLAVIHLTRRNTLHTLISLKRAFVTDQWWSLQSDGQDTTRVHLEPEECRRYFHKLDTCVEEADAAFAAHPKLDVVYEDLVEQREDELRRVFAFLDVPDRPVSTRMQKQTRGRASDVVENYGQLKECFQHTRWHVFFEH